MMAAPWFTCISPRAYSAPLVLTHLVVGLLELLHQVVDDGGAVVHVYQPQGVQRSSGTNSPRCWPP